jgi:hypothetical protein
VNIPVCCCIDKRSNKVFTTPAGPACATCRQKSRRCDRVRPICGRCVSKRLDCGGYPEKFRFCGLASRGKWKDREVPTTDKDRGEDVRSPDASREIRQADRRQADARPRQQSEKASVDGDTLIDDDALETPTRSALDPWFGSIYLTTPLHAELVHADNATLSPSPPIHLPTPEGTHEIDRILLLEETEKLLTHCKLPQVCNRRKIMRH